MYHTGIGGYIQSYNWQGNNQIHGSKWSTCIRREDGYCQIAYRAKGGETIDTFQLDDSATTALAVSHRDESNYPTTHCGPNPDF